MDFLTTNNKLSIHQSGNRKQHSTETALIYVTDELLKAIDEKTVSLLVLLDMSKAFDSLHHNLLLKNCIILVLSNLQFHGSVATYQIENKGYVMRTLFGITANKTWGPSRIYIRSGTFYNLY